MPKGKGLRRAGDALEPLLAGLAPPAAQPEPITPLQGRLVDAAADIALNSATPEDACFLHSVLCQVGMPRKRTDGLSFERTNGSSSLLLTAGRSWNGREWIQQTLPYGPKPRLILINLTSAAVMRGSRIVDVGRSLREFMGRMGLDAQGSEYRSLRRQIAALAVCRMQLGARLGNTVVNIDTQPIHRFDVWLAREADQQALWPSVVELSQEYFDSVREHAVPLDERAVAALRGSSLALDVYAWLAHRLGRVKQPVGVPWRLLQAQFGGYQHLDDFRRELRGALRQVKAVYPGANIEESGTGLTLRHSHPPIGRLLVAGR